VRNLDPFESERVLENVRELEPHPQARTEALLELLSVGELAAPVSSRAAELVGGDPEHRFHAEERERLLRASVGPCSRPSLSPAPTTVVSR
jgi:hypothetical protein